MINLLPSQQKEELVKEEKLKLFLILGIVVMAFLFSLFLILFAIRMSVISKLDVQNIYFEQKERELNNVQKKGVEEEIKKYNNVLSQLDLFYKNEPSFISILEKISATFPQGSYLTFLKFDSRADQISLTGFSPSREALLEFKKNLEANGNFKGVTFDPGNYLEPININFSVSFKLNDSK